VNADARIGGEGSSAAKHFFAASAGVRDVR